MSRRGDANQPEFPFLFCPPIIVPQGGGEYLVKPGKPVSKLTPLEFARAARISRSSVYNLIDADKVRAERPLPRKILIPSSDLDGILNRQRRPGLLGACTQPIAGGPQKVTKATKVPDLT
jgi:hypothetical protein